jgi:hypothetical protein
MIKLGRGPRLYDNYVSHRKRGENASNPSMWCCGIPQKKTKATPSWQHYADEDVEDAPEQLTA